MTVVIDQLWFILDNVRMSDASAVVHVALVLLVEVLVLLEGRVQREHHVQ